MRAAGLQDDREPHARGHAQTAGIMRPRMRLSILAADGRIPSAERLEDTIILGDVNEDGTIPPVDADLTDLAAYAARRLEIHRIIIPSANLAGTTIPTGVEVIGLGRIDELLNQ